MNIKNKFFLLALATLVTVNFSACAKKQVKKNADELTEEQKQDEIESSELDIHGKEFVPNPALETIYFDYDSPDLSEAARQSLAKNAEFLKKHKELEILSEGHCDERGTIGYNLALGQKRAASVRKYYSSLGIKSERVGSLSYGKEKPQCPDNTEECWAKNRRVETKVRLIASEDKAREKEAPEPNAPDDKSAPKP